VTVVGGTTSSHLAAAATPSSAESLQTYAMMAAPAGTTMVTHIVDIR
jgi:hypothetical protein